MQLSALDWVVIVGYFVINLAIGVFYYRHPGEPEGRIFSITEKVFPAVVGDAAAMMPIRWRSSAARHPGSGYVPKPLNSRADWSV